jgi:hypothetical protein
VPGRVLTGSGRRHGDRSRSAQECGRQGDMAVGRRRPEERKINTPPSEAGPSLWRKGRTYRVNASALQWPADAGAGWFDAYRAWLRGMG